MREKLRFPREPISYTGSYRVCGILRNLRETISYTGAYRVCGILRNLRETISYTGAYRVCAICEFCGNPFAIPVHTGSAVFCGFRGKQFPCRQSISLIFALHEV